MFLVIFFICIILFIYYIKIPEYFTIIGFNADPNNIDNSNTTSNMDILVKDFEDKILFNIKSFELN